MKKNSLLVTLKVSSDHLRSLPDLTPSESGTTTPMPKKTTQKKKPTSATALALGASPTPESPKTMEGTPAPTAKTSLSRVINAEDFKLDKSGKPVRKWVKKRVDIQSFTGYYMQLGSWTGGPKEQDDSGKSGLKIQIKLNNKNLNVGEEESVVDSREQSPALDDISSVLSTPEASTVSTPLP